MRTPPPLRRLKVMSLLLAGLSGLAGFTGAQAAEPKVLNIYNWSDYIAEDTIKNFEKETGIKVNYDNYDANEVLHAKLVAGKTGYDIVVPGAHFAKAQIEGGLLQKLDRSKLTNWGNLDKGLLEQLAKVDPGNEHLVDWLWGYIAVGINTTKVKAALGDLPMPCLLYTSVGPFYKGLTVSVPLHLSQLGGKADAAALHATLQQRYAGERFIRVMPLRDEATLAGGFFDVQGCNGTNRVDLFVFASSTQVLLMARLDNLGKGASGAAVQAMNVHLGVDEGLGL